MKKPKTGRPPLNDGLTKDQRYKAKGNRIVLIGSTTCTPEEHAELGPKLEALAEKHGSKRAFLIWAIREHYKEK